MSSAAVGFRLREAGKDALHALVGHPWAAGRGILFPFILHEALLILFASPGIGFHSRVLAQPLDDRVHVGTIRLPKCRSSGNGYIKLRYILHVGYPVSLPPPMTVLGS